MNNIFENVSIIIPTLNRPSALNHVLGCIEQLSCKIQEVIVVNQGNNLDDLIPLWESRLPILWLSQDCANPSAARNLGIMNARSEWILFLDDDISFKPDLLEKYQEAYTDLNFDICNGSVITPNESISHTLEPETESRFINLWSNLSSFRTYAGSKKIIGTCSANLLVKKSVLVNIGGFDERYKRLEDVEIGIRISQAGYSLWHDGRPLVNHFHITYGGSRNTINSWVNQHLSALLPNNLGAQLLILKQYYPWNQRLLLIFRLFNFFIKPSRLYLECPTYPFIVLRSISQSINWANKAYNDGAKLLR